MKVSLEAKWHQSVILLQNLSSMLPYIGSAHKNIKHLQKPKTFEFNCAAQLFIL